MSRSYGPSVNHLVLTVRDIEASHKFYTEVLGFERHGMLGRETLDMVGGTKMYFYQGHPDAHHDIALVQSKGDVEAPEPWGGFFPDGNGIEVLYELPKEIWENDINGALNFFEMMPTEGADSLVDDTNYHQFVAVK